MANFIKAITARLFTTNSHYDITNFKAEIGKSFYCPEMGMYGGEPSKVVKRIEVMSAWVYLEDGTTIRIDAEPISFANNPPTP